MSRRASRPSGNRTRSRSAVSAQPLLQLTNLLKARGTDHAEAALDLWVDALVESPEIFQASAAFLANAAGVSSVSEATSIAAPGFTRDERWLLLSLAAEIADDPILGDCCAELERRMELEVQEWPERSGEQSSEAPIPYQDSPLYRTLSDAWTNVRLAIEVSFLRDIGMTEMTRAMLEDPNTWERALRDGEATLLGMPRIVLTAEDDPFGILM